jgi:hypothetical protein
MHEGKLADLRCIEGAPKALGLTVSPSLLASADEVIE